MSGCLTESELHRYRARELEEAAAARVRTHLGACSDCAGRDAYLVADHASWITQLQEAGPPSETESKGPESTGAPVAEHLVAGYRILEEISRGGQGIVYRAIQQSTKREVALKVLREGPFASSEASRRFEREIELIAGFRHPNIVTVFDSGTTAEGRQYCAMDYVGGDRLHVYVRRRELASAEVLTLFVTVCDAVNYAHQRGVIHRDLKPSNILVEADGQPKVLDFGLAKQLAGDADTVVTTAGVITGTLPYLSPEQVSGRPDEVDIRSDLYSLGVVLYELLTGQYPYPMNGGMAEVLDHIRDTPPLSLRKALRDLNVAGSTPPRTGVKIDDELETIVLKALAKERERRYQSVGEFARDLRHYLAGEPIEAKADSTWYVLRKTVSRHRAAVGVAVSMLLIVSISVVALAVMYGTQSRLLAEVQQQREIALAAEARAQRRFDEQRSLANSFLTELDPKIQNLAGSTPAREWVVAKGLEYLNQLVVDSNDDVRLQQDLAIGYLKLGDVQGDPHSASLGDQDGAMSSYSKGLELLNAVAGTEPASADVQRELWLAHNHIANLLGAMGRAEEASSHRQKASECIQLAIQLDPQDRRFRRDLTYGYNDAAHQLLKMGRADDALAILREGLKIIEELAVVKAQSDVLRHDMASLHGAIAKVHDRQGQYAASLESYGRCLELLAALCEADPDNVRFRSDLGVSYERVGFARQQLGRHAEALDSFRQSLEIAEALAALETNNASLNANLRASYCRVGEVELALGQTAAAESSFRQYVEVSSAMATENPKDSIVLRDQGVSFYKMAEFHKVLAEGPERSRAERLQHERAARTWLERARDVFVEMRESGMLASSDAGVPAEITGEIAQCSERISSYEQAHVSEGDPNP